MQEKPAAVGSGHEALSLGLIGQSRSRSWFGSARAELLLVVIVGSTTNREVRATGCP